MSDTDEIPTPIVGETPAVSDVDARTTPKPGADAAAKLARVLESLPHLLYGFEALSAVRRETLNAKLTEARGMIDGLLAK